MNKFLTDFKKFTPLLLNLSAKDFKLKYRRSFLGVLWSILNPLLIMLVLTKVFGVLLKVKVENFATYYLVGSTVWNFFSEATTNSVGSILAGAPLIKKVYLPKYIFPVEKCIFALINFAFSMIAVIIVMLIQGVYPCWASLLAVLPIIYCFIFCLGMSLILSSLTVYFRDIMHLYGILLTVWMYLTPIIYPMSILDDQPVFRQVVMLNPMYHYVEYFRAVMMHSSDPAVYAIPGIGENLICIAIALVTLGIGSLIFAKAQKKFILHI